MQRSTALLLVGFPGEDEDIPATWLLETEEALLSFTRAAMAGGLILAMRADPVAAPLVALTAAEYAPPSQMGRAEPVEPLVEIFSGETADEQLELAFTGLEHAQMFSLGGRLSPNAEDERSTASGGSAPAPSIRQLLERVQPAAAVLLGDTRQLVDDFRALRQHHTPLHVVATFPEANVERGDMPEYDVTGRLLAEIDWRDERIEEDLPIART